MKKLKAFTILELMVTMIISSLVIGIIYTSYDFIGKQFISYKVVNEEITEAMTSNSLINRDINDAGYIQKTTGGIHIIYKKEKSLNYIFEVQYVIREINNVRDTFSIPIFNVEMRLLNEKQLQTGGLIDELLLTTQVTGETQQFRFKKQYAADVLMELDKH